MYEDLWLSSQSHNSNNSTLIASMHLGMKNNAATTFSFYLHKQTKLYFPDAKKWFFVKQQPKQSSITGPT
jgi:hypothetical protein